ncbi:GntR family transcriptional regulator [Mycolicibacterium chitae]|uniref:GntR family transcriptional regulator n=1 Tax=Mycolicibacterium chitae TaxID=1792 RepID=UPI000F8274D9|nr:GntR family transcriptional regulator [Mycolicibacterium chitae]MCV7106286.1 GntR family transcriptional regulator [Mycolicibacterium chitae]BBZ03799.1 GntR family transcriptional regulator [Mycolicibacterium chitae]
MSETVINGLRHALLTGEIDPGTKLSQSRLAQQFGVSRIPVRDAVQALVAEGLIEMIDGVPHARGLSILELQELYEIRTAVEPNLTQIAASGVGRAETIQMAQHFDTMANTTDVVEWLDANASFHALIYHRANRPRTIELVDQLRKLTDRYLYLHLAVIGNVEHLQEEHAAILDAAKANDGPLLKDLTRKHLETSHEFIVHYLLACGDSEH